MTKRAAQAGQGGLSPVSIMNAVCFSAGIAVALSAVWITAHCICVGSVFYGPPCTCF